MDISSALRVLRDTPREILRRHARDATTTLREMERRLKDLLQDKEPDSEDLPACHLCKQALSSTTREEFDTMASTAPFRPTESFGQMGTRSGCGNDAGNSKTSQPRTRFPSMADTAQDRPAALLKALLEVIPSAWELIAKEPVKVIHKKRALQQDRRVDDILRVDGNKAPSNEDKLFRGLAQRSFAIQYSQYQRENQKYLRVDELFDDISSHKQGQQNALHKRRKGCISSWVRQHFTSAEGQNNTIIRCVHAGIKQLVLEKFLQQRLEPRPANACGISALMALTVHNFKILHLEEIPSFLDLVFAGSSKVSLPVGMLNVTVQETNTASRHVLDIFEEVSPWFEKFQREYDGISPTSANKGFPNTMSRRMPRIE